MTFPSCPPGHAPGLRLALTLALALGAGARAQTAQPAAPATTTPSQSTTGATTSTASTLTLEAALARLAQAPSVTQAQLSVQVAQQNLDAARRAPGVSVSLTASSAYAGGFTTTAADGTATDTASSLSSSVGAQANLGLLPWSSGRLGLARAQRSLTLAQAQFREAQASARLNVYQQYLAAVIAQRDVTLAQNTLTLRQRQLQIAQTQRSQNNATQESVLTAQAGVQLAQATLLEAQSNLEVARLSLGSVLNQSLTGVTFSTAPASTFTLPDLNTLITRARTTTSTVIDAQNDLADAQEALETLQRSTRLPDLTASVRYGPAGSGGLSTSVDLQAGDAGVGYSVPIGGSGSSAANRVVASVTGSYVVYSPSLRAQVSAAQANVTQAQLTVQVDQQNAELSVRTLYSTAQTSLIALQSSATQVQVAQATLSAARARLAAGTGTAEDVTSAEIALAQAQRNLVQARVTVQLDLIRLQNAAGGFQ